MQTNTNSMKLTAKPYVLISTLVDIEKVQSGYNGKRGCCCGCLGKHSYMPAYVEQASKERGYAVTPDEVRPRSVAATVKKINAALKGEVEVESVMVDPGFVSVDIDGRTYTAYFAK